MNHFCYITGIYPRYDGLMFLRQGKSLVEAGFKVSYIVCDSLPDEVNDGINIISTHFVPKGRNDRIWKTRKVLLSYALKVDADIYQTSDPELMGMVTTLKKRGKKVIFNLREYYPDLIVSAKPYLPRFIRKPLSFIIDRYQSHVLSKYDAVFTITDWILNILREQYHIKTSYLLTNYPRINKNFSLSYEQYASRENRLCYEGTIYRVSRQENVFDALSSIGNIKYLLAGKIEEQYEWIKQHPYWEKVEFIDGFKLSDLPVIFGRSTISNVFRDFEGREGSSGVMKVFESMEQGLPVLFADVPVYRKINEKYSCGICVDPNNVESIRTAILNLINNKKEAYEMGQRGRKAVELEYNWETQAIEYIKVIKSIVRRLNK